MSVGMKIGLGFALSLALLVSVGFVARQNTLKLLETASMVTHSHSVLEKLTELRSLITEYESSGRGYALSLDESYLDGQAGSKARVMQALSALRRLTEDNPVQQRRLDTLEPLVSDRLDVRDAMIRLRREQGLDAANARAAQGKVLSDAIWQVVEPMDRDERALLEQRARDAEDSARTTEQLFLAAIVTAFMLVGGIGLIISRDITNSVAARDALIRAIRDATQELGSASAELLAATSQQGTGAQEQAAAIAQTATTADEITQTAEQSAERSRSVADVSQHIVAVAQTGKQAVSETTRCIGELRQQVESIAKNIFLLSESAQSIGDLITTVSDLAEQSNILALNAAIEASRAGEHGRGFAVVAAEVRALAEHSKKATKQVRTLLSDIQRQTSKAVLITEEGTKGADSATQAVSQAGEVFHELSESIANSAQAALQVAASAGQQALGIAQIQLAIKDINQVTIQSLAATRQIERASQDLNLLSTRLRDLVGSAA